MNKNNNELFLSTIQVLRALAFFGIFLWHTERIGIRGTGYFGVCVFFVLSGFLIAIKRFDCSEEYQFNVGKSAVMACKRISKLYPLHILMILMTVPFELMREDCSAFLFISRLLPNALLVQSLIPNDTYYWSFNWASWFLSTYFVIMLVSPFIERWVKKQKNVKATAIIVYIIQSLCAIILYYRWVALFPKNSPLFYWFIYISPIYRVCEYTIGMCLGLNYCKNHHIGVKNTDVGNSIWKSTIYEIVVIIFAGLIIASAQKDFVNSAVWFSRTELYIPPSCALIWVFAEGKGKLSKLLTKKVLIRLGDLSGYGFLIHQVVIRYFDKIVKYTGLSITWLIILTEFAITIVASVIVEKIMTYTHLISIKKKS